jgi:hypothetical protein
MKKLGYVLFALILAAGMTFMACDDGGGDDGDKKKPTEKVTITFKADTDTAGAGVIYNTTNKTYVLTIDKGSALTAAQIAALPDGHLVGKVFKGWNSQQNGAGSPPDTTTKHDINKIFYAQYGELDLDDLELVKSDDINTSDATNVTTTTRQAFLPDDLIAAMRENPTGVLVLFFDATDDTRDNDRDGWTIGKIGIYQGDAIALVTEKEQGPPEGEPTGKEYSIRVEVKWLLDILDKGETGDKLGVYNPTNNLDKWVGYELYKVPDAEWEPPARPLPPPAPAQVHKEYYIFVQNISAAGDWIGFDAQTGKGSIAGDDLQAIKDLAEEVEEDVFENNGVLRFYLLTNYTQNVGNWNDLGKINNTTNPAAGNTTAPDGRIGGPQHSDVARGKVGGSISSAHAPAVPAGFNATVGYWHYDIPVKALGTLGTSIEVNPYNGTHITRIELWKPDPTADAPEFDGTLDVNENSGGKGEVTIPLSAFAYFSTPYEGASILKKNAELKLDIKVTATAEMTLEFFWVDNSAAAGWWNELTSSSTPKTVVITSVAAGEDKGREDAIEASLEFVIGDWATSDSDAANKLFIRAAGIDGEDLNFWEIKLTETKAGDEPLPPGEYEPKLTKFQNLGEFHITGGQNGWATAGMAENEGDEPTQAQFAAAKFLVLEVEKKADNNGIGGLEIEVQSENTGDEGWGVVKTVLAAVWLQPGNIDSSFEEVLLPYNTAEIRFIVVDLSTVNDWDTAIEDTQLKLFVSIPGQLSFKAGYITDEDLTMPTTAGSAIELRGIGSGGHETLASYEAAGTYRGWLAIDVPEGHD